jgi:hypothetical protein
MGSKSDKWQEHLKVAEASDMTLAAYAVRHRINVHRLYEARHARVKTAANSGAAGKNHVSAFARVNVAARANTTANPTGSKLEMQARLGNGVVVSWTHDADTPQALATVLHNLAALPCFI